MKTPSRIRIATDSVSDLPDALAAEYGIMVVPATITFGKDTYLEGVNLTREDFYGRLIEYAGLPKTAAPGPGAFTEGFQRIIAENREAGVPLDGIVSFHPPAAVSGLYNSAYAGSQMIEGPRIEIIDSGQVSMGMGLQCILASRAAAAGSSMDEILGMAKEMIPRTRIIAGLETLEWAARSGRINRVVAAVGNLLAVKPMLSVYNGDITLAERVRTHSRQVERALEITRSWAPFRELAVVHARAPELAEQLADRMADIHPRQRIVVAELGCILGSYVGPGAYGLIAVQA